MTIFISKAPEDLEEHKLWAKQMARIQYAMWIDGKSKCEQCGHVYTSVDDFIERNPKRGYGKDFFVDNKCWKVYMKRRKR